MDSSPRVCIPNIGARQRRQRLAGGVVAAVVAVLLFAALWATDAPRVARILVALPTFPAVLGFLQYREST